MWLLIYTTQQAKRLEILLAAINSGDYRKCKNVIYGKILDILTEKRKDRVRYMEIETKAEETKAKKSLTSLPALVRLVHGEKGDEITHVYYEQDIMVADFELPAL